MPEKCQHTVKRISRQSSRRRLSMRPPARRPAQQLGQASVFVVILIVVVLVGVLVLFNSGQLTRQKMEVQNAADAAAYSAAVLRARSMNFMAYTNRAMVANEMAIGQFSAFASWRKKYNLARNGLTPMMTGVVLTLDSLGAYVGITLGQYFRTAVTAPMKVLHYINTVLGGIGYGLGVVFEPLNVIVNTLYGGFQWAMRAAVMMAQLETVPKLIKANAGDEARLSNFGALAAVLSMVEQERFMAFAGPDINADAYDNAVPRYMALVNDSRDPWTRDRRREDLQTPPLTLNLIDTPIIKLRLDDFGMGYISRGGSELRTVGDEEDPGWSSLDTIAFGVVGTFNIDIFNPFTGGWENVPIPLSALQISLAGAAQERVLPKGDVLGRGRVDDWKDGRGQYGLYGSALWDTPAAFAETVALGYQKKTQHHGLAHYHFIDPNRYAGGQNPPIVLIGVRRDLTDLETSDQLPPGRRMGGGRLKLETVATGANEGEIGGLVERALNKVLGDLIREILPPELLSPPYPVDQFVDPNALVDDMVADLVGPMRPAIDQLVDPLDINRGRQAMFALAGARIYYKNPENDSELGSLFNPYWEVRLQAVDDNVKKWSLVTQDRRFGQIVSYLAAADLDPEETGVRGELEWLDAFAE